MKQDQFSPENAELANSLTFEGKSHTCHSQKNTLAAAPL